MNNCILMAQVVQEPQLRYTSDTQTPIAEMVVQFEGLREGDAPSQIKVIGWGNLGQDMQAKYRQGDRLILEGRLGMNLVENPMGYKEKFAELTAQRIHQLAGGEQIVGMSASDPTAMRNPAAPASMPPVATQPSATQPMAQPMAAQPMTAQPMTAQPMAQVPMAQQTPMAQVPMAQQAPMTQPTAQPMAQPAAQQQPSVMPPAPPAPTEADYDEIPF